MKKIVLIFLLCPVFIVFSQDYLAKNEYYYGIANRLNMLVIEEPAVEEMTMGVAFKIGTFHESTLQHGFCYLFSQGLIQEITNILKYRVLEFEKNPDFFKISAAVSADRTLVSVTGQPKHLDVFLNAFYTALSNPVSEAETRAAMRKSNTELLVQSTDTFYRLRNLIEQHLWTSEYHKRSIMVEWNEDDAADVTARLAEFQLQYLCPRNSLLILKGNVRQNVVYNKFKDLYINWQRCILNPYSKFPSPSYKMLLNSCQVKDVNEQTNQPFFLSAYQAPTTFEDRKANLCLLLLSALMKAPGTQLHSILKDSCRLASFYLENEIGKHINQLLIGVTPEPGHLAEGYACFRHVFSKLTDSIYLNENELALAKEQMIQDFRKIKSNTSEHVNLAGKYWASYSLNYYSTFEDSINAITTVQMEKAITKYLNEKHSANGLSIGQEVSKSSGVEKVFSATGVTIRDYRLNFLENTAKFTSAAEDSVFNSLVQFLKINPKLNVKVNGVAHKSELTQITDKAMVEWVRTLDNYILNPPSLLTKKKFRLDVYRSLTIIKKLTEAGIEIDRIFGTGQLRKESKDAKKSQFVYCSQMVS